MPRLLMIADGTPHVSGDSDAKIVLRRPVGMPESFDSAHDWALADLAALAAGQGAEAEGFDAVCLADFGDYGAGALRSVLSVPVVTAGRSAMLHALTLGSAVAVLTPAAGYRRAKKLVEEYGLGAQCPIVRFFDDPRNALTVARSCIEDGADVICLAGLDGSLTAGLAAELPVPIIDPPALTVKLAESFLGLGLSQSRRSWPEPQVRKSELVTALIAAGEEA